MFEALAKLGGAFGAGRLRWRPRFAQQSLASLGLAELRTWLSSATSYPLRRLHCRITFCNTSKCARLTCWAPESSHLRSQMNCSISSGQDASLHTKMIECMYGFDSRLREAPTCFERVTYQVAYRLVGHLVSRECKHRAGRAVRAGRAGEKSVWHISVYAKWTFHAARG